MPTDVLCICNHWLPLIIIRLHLKNNLFECIGPPYVMIFKSLRRFLEAGVLQQTNLLRGLEQYTYSLVPRSHMVFCYLQYRKAAASAGKGPGNEATF